ncbi:MAG: glycosyl hydrolase family 18 protein [Lachnospiraceae bacterium]|nr:glycosyl hydrolase family 18 protein [Lachnospiraceae bacterium]
MSDKKTENRKQVKRLTAKSIIILAAVVIIVGFLVGAVIRKYTPSSHFVDLSRYSQSLFGDKTDYYGVKEGEASIFFENERIEETAIVENSFVYLDYDLINEYLSKELYLDKNEKVLIYAIPSRLYKAFEDESYCMAGDERVEYTHIIYFQRNGKYYISLDYLSEFENINYSFYTSPNRVVFKHRSGSYSYYDVTNECVLREHADIRSDGLRVLKPGETLWCLKQTDGSNGRFAKLMTKDGIVGYAQTKDLSEVYEKKYTYEKRNYAYAGRVDANTERVVLGWHMINTESQNSTFSDVVKKNTPMNVIVPTWLRVESEFGDVKSIGSIQYVEKAHAEGLKVWALIDNFDSMVNTLNFLSRTSSRTKIINEMIAEAKKLGVDGINIDFESLNSNIGPHFVEFVKEASIACRKENLILSVDILVPFSYNSYFRTETLGVFADYVAVMAYDEHYAGSETAGSVASIGFTDFAIELTKNKMDENRIIIGVPFFTRLWKEETKFMVTELSSQVMSMDAAQGLLDRNGIVPVWDSKTAQYYAEYGTDELKYKIWLENYASLNSKLSHISKSGIRGVAIWRLGMEQSQVWELFEKFASGKME